MVALAEERSFPQRSIGAGAARLRSSSTEAIANAGKNEIPVPLLRVLAPDAVLCTDGWPFYAGIAKDADIARFALSSVGVA